MGGGCTWRPAVCTRRRSRALQNDSAVCTLGPPILSSCPHLQDGARAGHQQARQHHQAGGGEVHQHPEVELLLTEGKWKCARWRGAERLGGSGGPAGAAGHAHAGVQLLGRGVSVLRARAGGEATAPASPPTAATARHQQLAGRACGLYNVTCVLTRCAALSFAGRPGLMQGRLTSHLLPTHAYCSCLRSSH